MHVRQRSPPPARRSGAPAKSPPPVPLPQLWAHLPAEKRRRLSQIMARVITRHGLLRQKEVPDD